MRTHVIITIPTAICTGINFEINVLNCIIKGDNYSSVIGAGAIYRMVDSFDIRYAVRSEPAIKNRSRRRPVRDLADNGILRNI